MITIGHSQPCGYHHCLAWTVEERATLSRLWDPITESDLLANYEALLRWVGNLTFNLLEALEGGVVEADGEERLRLNVGV